MSNWQPIETAPKDDKYILICCYWNNEPDLKLVKCTYWKNDDWGWECYSKVYYENYVTFTHWMPLPEPPK
jgi:hypothetical protein